jgi:hypothetical protein
MAGMVMKSALGRYAYEKSGVRNVVHSIPIVGDIASIFGFEKGGRVPKTGAYLAHQGELVVPSGVVKKFAKQGPTRHKATPSKSKGKGKGKGKSKGGPKKGVVPPQFRKHLKSKKKKH